ncbi:MAG: hypothetical protein Q9160_008430 [Pyrenula sp. 1 TL-2023]
MDSSQFSDRVLACDYAGQELFVIDGDSLLLECFNDSTLDYDAGFQILHAVYIIERFLQNLARRQCRFDIAFFDTHAGACIPPDKPFPYKYRLTRLLAIEHLKRNAQALSLLQFRSPRESNFQAYLEKAKVYFIACSDGARYRGAKVKAASLIRQEVDQKDSQASVYHRALLRHSIRYYATVGLDVALLNGMEFRDSKVFCFVIAGSKRPTSSVISLPQVREISSDSNQNTSSNQTLPNSEIDQEAVLSALENVRKNLGLASMSSRLLMTAIAVKRMSSTARDEFFARACLVHAALLEMLPLSRRNCSLQLFSPNDEAEFESSLQQYCRASCQTLTDPDIKKFPLIEVTFTPDYLDGRLLRQVWRTLKNNDDKNSSVSPNQIVVKLSALLTFACIKDVEAISASIQAPKLSLPRDETMQAASSFTGRPLLPFVHLAFAEHLSSIQVTIEGQDLQHSHEERSFLERKHWHNSKKSLMPRKGHDNEQHREAWWLRRHQRFLNNLSTYAASLTNASGKVLAPELIFVESSKGREPAQAPRKSPGKQVSKDRNNKSTKIPTKSASAGRNAISASQAEKMVKEMNKAFEAWDRKRKDLDKTIEPADRFIAASSYEIDLAGRTNIDTVTNELLLYRLAVLLQLWKAHCQNSDKASGYHLVAMAVDLLHRLSEMRTGVPKEAPSILFDVSKQLGLPVPRLRVAGERSLSFPFIVGSNKSLRIEMDPITFRLLHGGPFMDRSMGSQEDHRVPFKPDAWQKEVLDELDQHTSLLLLVPTSGGKTFISFYAMEKVLRAGNDDVVVYVAPTKALVNQVAAEISARFKKNYEHGGKALCSIHTRDMRVHKPTQCQVLVTVPHILQIMLLSPSNKDWVPKVKTIIFDEVHSISASEDGVVWEQLLMMAPCQIIALSATVGNPEAFGAWLQSTQEAKGSRFRVIKHEHRFSDLRKYSFRSEADRAFQGLGKPQALSSTGLNNTESFDYLHPISALTSSARGIPADLALESRDCALLFDVIKKCETREFPVPADLAPESTFGPDAITKRDVISWAKRLKDFLATWMTESGSPFRTVVTELSKSRSDDTSDGDDETLPANDGEQHKAPSKDVSETALLLLQDLHNANALPAILFNFARGRCEEIAVTVYDRLLEAEDAWKAKSSAWRTKVVNSERSRKGQEAAAKKAGKLKTKLGKHDRSQGDEAAGLSSKAERERESLESSEDTFKGFDPDKPLDGFSFANPKKSDQNEIDNLMERLRKAGIHEKLISAFRRGIAAHHSGFNKAYRQAVEIWFRRGYLTVVVATGTLALGINMPCKTVVFTEDSVFLNTLNYRQASGRAGRRGFDLLGNVVFHGISKDKARRLMSSRIPALIGHFPVTTSLVLRLLILLDNTNNAPYAMKMVDSLLSQPRLYLGGESFRHQVLHHLRFSIEYLRRQGLVAADGAPINFASSIAHLYYVEKSAFAFHALLRGGYFSGLAKGIVRNEEATLNTSMLVMAHCFFRHPLRQVEKESEDAERIRKSPSVVFLPAFPEVASRIMKRHNEETLETYTTYVWTFVNQHCKERDETLPFTRLNVNNQCDTDDRDNLLKAFVSDNPPVHLRSPFVALSGHTDDFASISSLCETVRSGVFLESAVVPYLEVADKDESNPLNAALYDFYRHGDVTALVKANKVRSGDVWFLLNDFSMVLATLVASLEGFLVSGGRNFDGDLEDVIGGVGEEAEEELEDKSEIFSDEKTVAMTDRPEMRNKKILSGRKNREAVLESWEDDEEEKDASDDAPSSQGASNKSWKGAPQNATMTPSPAPTRSLSPASATRSTAYTSKDSLNTLPTTMTGDTEEDLRQVLHMFRRLKEEFDGKFRKIFA